MIFDVGGSYVYAAGNASALPSKDQSGNGPPAEQAFLPPLP